MTWTTARNRLSNRHRTAAARLAAPAGGGSAGVRPVETLENRRLLSADVSASWNLAANTGTGPSTFGGHTFDQADAPQLLLDLGSGQVEVQSFSWGVSNAGSISGGGTGAGKATLADLNVQTVLGSAAPGVFRAVSAGRHLPEVVLEGRDREGGDVQFRYTLEDVLVSGYSMGAPAAGAAGYPEAVSFAYREVKFEQFEYNPGLPVETHAASWSFDQTGSGATDFGGERFSKGGEPPITLDFPGGSIGATSFSWGATQVVSTTGGGGSGRANLGDLSVTSRVGEASPSLFFAAVTGRHLPSVVLESRDGTHLRYTLGDVAVRSYQADGGAGSPGATENFTLDFASIEIEQFEAPPGTGPLPPVEWDQVSNTGGGPRTFGGFAFPAGAEPDLLLDLGSGMVELDSFSWGASNLGTVGTGGGAGSGVTRFQDFSFTAAPSAASPGLIFALASGRHVPEAVLVVRNDSGDVDARYTLGDVLVTGYQTATAAGNTAESYALNFASVALEQTQYDNAGAPAGTRAFSWDTKANTGTGTTNFGSRTLPAGTGGLVLKLGNWELPASAFSWGATNVVDLGGTGAGSGKVNFAGVAVSAELGEVTPTLLRTLAAGAHMPRAVLQQRDGQGRVEAEYLLEDVIVQNYSTGGAAGGDAPDAFTLGFREVTLSHTARDLQGGVTGTRTVSWDLAANVGSGQVDFTGTSPADPAADNQLLIDGEDLDVLSFSWGASNAGTILGGGSGAGGGKVTMGDLSLQLESGAATPSWVLATANGRHLPTAVLESRDAEGDVYLRYTLTDVVVSSFQTSAGADGAGTDSVSLAFAGIELEQIGPGNRVQKSDWNIKTNTGHGQASFGDQVFPTHDEPPLLLRIDGDELAPFGFSIGASNISTFGGGGGGSGKVNLTDFSASGAAGTATAGLMYAVASGRHIPQAVLEVRDDQGNVVRTITLRDVLVTSHQVGGSGPETSESFTLAYTAITLTTRDVDAPAPLEVSVSGPSSGPEGSALHLDAAATSADGAAAGTIHFVWSVARDGNVVASGTGDDVDFVPADDGTYVLTVNAAAANGGTGAASRTIVVANVAPTLSIFGSATVNERTPYTITFSAADPGADTITQWAVNWGDGSAATLLAGTATSAGHTYAAGGRTYVITLTATDEDGSYNATHGVTVLTPKQAVDAVAGRLEALVAAGGLPGGNATALQSKLAAAKKSLDAASGKAAAGQLGALINQLEALSGKKLAAGAASSLIEEARAILALIA